MKVIKFEIEVEVFAPEDSKLFLREHVGTITVEGKKIAEVARPLNGVGMIVSVLEDSTFYVVKLQELVQPILKQHFGKSDEK